jgi:hypothetical protein
VNETQVDAQTALPESDSDELIAAQQEQIRLLTEANQALANPVTPENSYDLDEVFVPEGQGTCLQCNCEQYAVPHPGERLATRDNPYTCGPCGHPRSIHKRNPAGAQARQP